MMMVFLHGKGILLVISMLLLLIFLPKIFMLFLMSGLGFGNLGFILKLSFFIWMLALNRVLLFVSLHYKGINVTIICPRCNCDVETALHAFRDCPMIRELWLSLAIPFTAFDDPDIDIYKWIKANCSHKRPCTFSNIPWATSFCFIL